MFLIQRVRKEDSNAYDNYYTYCSIVKHIGHSNHKLQLKIVSRENVFEEGIR